MAILIQTPQELNTHLAGVTAREMADFVQAHPNRAEVIELLNRRSNEALVGLISSHNPYTKDPGDMSIFAGNADPNSRAGNDIAQIDLEVDGPYTMAMEWNFKGIPQKINKTMRLKYRYRARDLNDTTRPLLKPDHWVTAYLLIGFEDGGF